MLAAVYTKPSCLKYSKKEICEFLYNAFHVKVIGIGNVFTEIEELKLSDNIKKDYEMEVKDLVEYTFDKIMNKQFFLINEVYDALSAFFNQVSMNEFCGAGTMSLFIDEVGNVYPCQLFVGDEEFYMGNILRNYEKSYEQSDDYISIRNKLKSVQKCSIGKCECCIAKFWCFRCIGQYKKESNFGACKNINECSYIVDITTETLNKIARYMSEGKFDELIESINYLASYTK